MQLACSNCCAGSVWLAMSDQCVWCKATSGAKGASMGQVPSNCAPWRQCSPSSSQASWASLACTDVRDTPQSCKMAAKNSVSICGCGQPNWRAISAAMKATRLPW